MGWVKFKHTCDVLRRCDTREALKIRLQTWIKHVHSRCKTPIGSFLVTCQQCTATATIFSICTIRRFCTQKFSSMLSAMHKLLPTLSPYFMTAKLFNLWAIRALIITYHLTVSSVVLCLIFTFGNIPVSVQLRLSLQYQPFWNPHLRSGWILALLLSTLTGSLALGAPKRK